MTFASRLFTWVQDADFCRAMFRDALMLVPDGSGQDFLDVGCGPGILTCLAAELGFRATGIDTDPNMVAAARARADHIGSSARFRTGSLGGPAPTSTAHVVAAASLLAVMPDPDAGLDLLWNAVAPGGTLLIVEATQRLTSANARALVATGTLGHGAQRLRLWAYARQGRTVVPNLGRLRDTMSPAHAPMLDGMVSAWAITKRTES